MGLCVCVCRRRNAREGRGRESTTEQQQGESLSTQATHCQRPPVGHHPNPTSAHQCVKHVMLCTHRRFVQNKTRLTYVARNLDEDQLQLRLECRMLPCLQPPVVNPNFMLTVAVCGCVQFTCVAVRLALIACCTSTHDCTAHAHTLAKVASKVATAPSPQKSPLRLALVVLCTHALVEYRSTARREQHPPSLPHTQNKLASYL